jgi:hypothetical protein
MPRRRARPETGAETGTLLTACEHACQSCTHRVLPRHGPLFRAESTKPDGEEGTEDL